MAGIHTWVLSYWIHEHSNSGCVCVCSARGKVKGKVREGSKIPSSRPESEESSYSSELSDGDDESSQVCLSVRLPRVLHIFSFT